MSDNVKRWTISTNGSDPVELVRGDVFDAVVKEREEAQERVSIIGKMLQDETNLRLSAEAERDALKATMKTQESWIARARDWKMTVIPWTVAEKFDAYMKEADADLALQGEPDGIVQCEACKIRHGELNRGRHGYGKCVDRRKRTRRGGSK